MSFRHRMGGFCDEMQKNGMFFTLKCHFITRLITKMELKTLLYSVIELKSPSNCLFFCFIKFIDIGYSLDITLLCVLKFISNIMEQC